METTRSSSTEAFWRGFEKQANTWTHAAELGGLGILAAHPAHNIIKGKSDWGDKAEVAGLGVLAAPSAVEMAKKAPKAWQAAKAVGHNAVEGVRRIPTLIRHVANGTIR